MQQLVSIIIPAFQAAKTISVCVESVLNQTYENIECIIVDDGSTDNTYEISIKIARKSNRVFVFQQENGGVSSARNLGISKCRGTYLTFVDADDVLDKNAIKYMVDLIKNCDTELVICNVSGDFTSFLHIAEYEQYTISNVVKNFDAIYGSYALHSVIGNLYKSDYLRNISFPVGVCMGEDLLFNLEYLKLISKIVISQRKIYIYSDNPNSATKKFREDDFDNQKMLFYKTLDFYQQYTNEAIIPYASYCVYFNNIYAAYSNLIHVRGIKMSAKYFNILFDERLNQIAAKKIRLQDTPNLLFSIAITNKSHFLLRLLGLLKMIKHRKKPVC